MLFQKCYVHIQYIIIFFYFVNNTILISRLILFQVREIDAGHVSGCLIHHPAFITAILDTFQRLLEKHHMTNVAENVTEDDSHEYKNVSETISNLPQFNRQYPSEGNPIRNFLKAIYAITT